MAIVFTIPGAPVAQPRQRHRIVGGGPSAFVHNYTPTKHPVTDFKAAAKYAFMQAHKGGVPDGPLALGVVFVLPRPKSLVWKRKMMPRVPCSAKPDCDNLCKSLMDALKGLAWRDDAQVVMSVVHKFYAAGDETAHTFVVVCDADNDFMRRESGVLLSMQSRKISCGMTQ